MVTIEAHPVCGGHKRPAMTPAEARGQIEEIRIELRRCMRSLSVPDVNWDEADAAVARVQALVADLRLHTLMKALEVQ